MRKHKLGASMPSRGWSPKFARKSPLLDLPPEKRDRPKSSTVMSWFPSWKEHNRSVPLRLTAHIAMAELLEADPFVDAWHSNSSGDLGRDEDAPDADFVARSGNSHIGYRIQRTVAPADADEAAILFQRIAGYERRVLQLDALKGDPRLPVAREILQCRSVPVSAELISATVRLVTQDNNPKTLGSLQAALGPQHAPRMILVALIGMGHLRVVLSDCLDMETPIVGVRRKGWLK